MLQEPIVQRSNCREIIPPKYWPPTPSPPGECVPPSPSLWCGGRTHSLGGGGGGGGSIFWMTPDTALHSTYVSTLWIQSYRSNIAQWLIANRPVRILQRPNERRPVAKFIAPDWGDIVDSGIGFSYWPARGFNHTERNSLGAIIANRSVTILQRPNERRPVAKFIVPGWGI